MPRRFASSRAFAPSRPTPGTTTTRLSERSRQRVLVFVFVSFHVVSPLRVRRSRVRRRACGGVARVDDDSDASRSRATRPSVDVGGAGVSGAGAALCAASLRATAGYGNEPPRGFITADEVARSRFVFGLIARSVAMDAERRLDESKSETDPTSEPRSGASWQIVRADEGRRVRDDSRLVDFASSDVCDASSSGDETRARLARDLNLGVARLCSALMDVEGLPEDAVLGLHPGGSSNAPDATPKKAR